MTVGEWIKREEKRFGTDGLVYVVGPSGMGCTSLEAQSVYKDHYMPPGCRTVRNKMETLLLARLKKGGMGAYIKMWRA